MGNIIADASFSKHLRVLDLSGPSVSRGDKLELQVPFRRQHFMIQHLAEAALKPKYDFFVHGCILCSVYAKQCNYPLQPSWQIIQH